MTKLEKVIQGLMAHGSGKCEIDDGICPYWEEDNCYQHLCQDAMELLEEQNAIDLHRDALKLLKEREPRVLTLEEVRERKPFHLWVEDLETGAQVFPVAYVGGLYVDSAEDWSVDPDHRNTPEYYGKSWRFWDKKPTNEQRQATPWDEPPEKGD